MADPAIEALRAESELLSGAAMPFRFEVTWRSLTRPLEPAPLSSIENAAGLPRRRAVAPDVEAREWEMVLPRMKRPPALTPAVEGEAERPAPTPPSFAVAGERTGGRWMAVGGALALMAAVGALVWNLQRSSPAAEVADTMEMGSAGWVSEWASDSMGSARGRQISLYRPSMAMSDYRLEFTGRIERKSLGWVFRAVDSRNYYVGKLERANPASPLRITRFAVIKGVEGPHVQRVLAAAAGAWRVRLEAKGPRFTIYLQNQVVEDWEDDRLKAGGVGFLNEREERGQVESVRISFPRGGVGR